MHRECSFQNLPKKNMMCGRGRKQNCDLKLIYHYQEIASVMRSRKQFQLKKKKSISCFTYLVRIQPRKKKHSSALSGQVSGQISLLQSDSHNPPVIARANTSLKSHSATVFDWLQTSSDGLKTLGCSVGLALIGSLFHWPLLNVITLCLATVNGKKQEAGLLQCCSASVL